MPGGAAEICKPLRCSTISAASRVASHDHRHWRAYRSGNRRLTSDRLHYTIIGDTVNTTQRIESVTRDVMDCSVSWSARWRR